MMTPTVGGVLGSEFLPSPPGRGTGGEGRRFAIGWEPRLGRSPLDRPRPSPQPSPRGRGSQKRLADPWFTVHGTVLTLKTGRPVGHFLDADGPDPGWIGADDGQVMAVDRHPVASLGEPAEQVDDQATGRLDVGLGDLQAA
jgi:hypothetical protein